MDIGEKNAALGWLDRIARRIAEGPPIYGECSWAPPLDEDRAEAFNFLYKLEWDILIEFYQTTIRRHYHA
jgi:hypothetical protein